MVLSRDWPNTDRTGRKFGVVLPLRFRYVQTIASADPNMEKTSQPTELMATAVLKTAGQLCVSSRM